MGIIASFLAGNQWEIPFLNVDLLTDTSKLCFDYPSTDFLHLFAKQADTAVHSFHCPIISLTHSGTFLSELLHVIPTEHFSMSFVLNMDGKFRGRKV